MPPKAAARLVANVVLGVIVAMTFPGCSSCPETTISELPSESRQYTAVTYTFECGPIPPFNVYLGLKGSDGGKRTEVVRVQNVPFELKSKWLGPNELLVEIECSLKDPAACVPPRDRTWSIDKKRVWRDVTLRFTVGPILQGVLSEQEQNRVVE